MITVGEISKWLQTVAPLELSEEWDNTGLLLGDSEATVERVQTCLTLTGFSAAEAIEKSAGLVIAHHPLPFQPLRKITTETNTGKLIWRLASHNIALYAPHTAWDSAATGINAMLAEKLDLDQVRPLIPAKPALKTGPQQTGPEQAAGLALTAELGAGRQGALPKPRPLKEIVVSLQQTVPHCRPRAVDSEKPIRRVAICCGSGGSLLSEAIASGCDLFLTGEATFHTCLEAEAAGISLLMLGHFASERFAMETLAGRLAEHIPSLEVWASQQERDPVIDL